MGQLRLELDLEPSLARIDPDVSKPDVGVLPRRRDHGRGLVQRTARETGRLELARLEEVGLELPLLLDLASLVDCEDEAKFVGEGHDDIFLPKITEITQTGHLPPR